MSQWTVWCNNIKHLIDGNTFHHQLGRAGYLLPGVLGDARVLPGVGQLHIDDVQLAVFAVRRELVFGVLAQVAVVLHPRGDGGGGRHLALEHGGRADGLGLLQHDVLNLLDELQRHGFELESREGFIWRRRAFSTGLQAAAPSFSRGRGLLGWNNHRQSVDVRWEVEGETGFLKTRGLRFRPLPRPLPASSAGCPSAETVQMSRPTR